MTRIYHCPHCRTQNFATPERLRLAGRVALICWKCGRKIGEPSARKDSKASRAKREKPKRS